MRHNQIYIVFLLLCFCMGMSAHTYTNQSKLSSGKWVKISVTESGMHYLTYDEIQRAGINPRYLRIYGYGGGQLAQDFNKRKIDDLPQVPYYTFTGNDGVFGSGDYVVFYAQGIVSWQFDGNRFTHTTNTYSTKGYYFLTEGTEEYALPVAQEPVGNVSYRANTYTALALHEVDSINLIDKSGKEGGGREFYEQFPQNRTIVLNTTFPGLQTQDSIDIRADLAAFSSKPSTFSLVLNGQQHTLTTENISTSSFYTKAKACTGNFSYQPSAGENQQLTLTFQNTTNGSYGYLNYVEFSATCALQLQGQPLIFRNKEHFGSNQLTQFSLSGADAETQVWNISQLDAIQRVATTLNADTLTFKGKNNSMQEYVAFRPSMKAAFHHPAIIGTIENQNLHSLSDIDMVIITPKEMIPAAQLLADAHERNDGMTTAVVTDQQVYNEFSSGTPDATAYRWLMKMLYDRSKRTSGAQAPKYLILMGDGTFDNRKLLPASGNNILLTYQAKNSIEETMAYASDDYFAFLDDNEGEVDINGRMDIAVGRFPVNSLDEAYDVVRKSIAYIENCESGKWKNQLVFLSDDGDSNQHTSISDMAAESIRSRNPGFIVNKIYLDAYTQETSAAGESYPLAKNKFENLMTNGVLFFDYSGHGGYNAITSESILTMKEIREMSNSHQGLWFLATCNFSSFDAGVQSAGEAAVLNPDGGAIATISSCRTVYAPQNGALNQLFCDTLFAHSTGHYTMSIGQALRCAKNRRGSDNNKMPYILLGDPAIRLAFPDDYNIVTTTNPDTLNALSIQTIDGYIENDGKDTASWFNGRLYVTVLDKMQQITTLDNDQPDSDKKVTYTYNDYPSPLFKGETSVVNGRFSYTFMVPKDIRYNYGNGRIVYYAIDSLSGEEGIGHYEQFLIGGSNMLEINDTTGPNLHIYLNTPSFTDGGATYEHPHFFAEISDEHGINTAGSGIGHDLLLTVDDDPNQTYIVNDYYSSSNNSYQQGIVSYRFSEMEEGAHRLTFRAWDLLNNSSTAALNFQVIKGYSPNICSVMSYPNPVNIGGNLHIVIDYDQPDQMKQTDVYIYDLSGRLVFHKTERGTNQVNWNLAEACVHAGVYVYKVQIQSSNSVVTSKAGKIIITE